MLCRASSWTRNMRMWHPNHKLALTIGTASALYLQAFISCRLDYCNSLLFGISDGLLRRLQSVQNAAARLVTGARRCDHITPVLRQLHWLPVRQCVVFKIAGLVHQSLVGAAPAYIADDCRLLSDVYRRPLRSNSNDMRKLLVPRTHNKLGDRSFSAAGPRLWNDLPPGLRRPGLTFDSFRQSLKTHLFGTEALSDSFEFIGAIEISLCIYFSTLGLLGKSLTTWVQRQLASTYKSTMCYNRWQFTTVILLTVCFLQILCSCQKITTNSTKRHYMNKASLSLETLERYQKISNTGTGK